MYSVNLPRLFLFLCLQEKHTCRTEAAIHCFYVYHTHSEPLKIRACSKSDSISLSITINQQNREGLKLNGGRFNKAVKTIICHLDGWQTQEWYDARWISLLLQTQLSSMRPRLAEQPGGKQKLKIKIHIITRLLMFGNQVGKMLKMHASISPFPLPDVSLLMSELF